MGKKKIKHLGRKKRACKYKFTLKKMIIFLGVMVSIIAISKVTKHLEDLYEEDDKLKFINSIKKYAIDNYNEYKILPSITVGQAILESGWGESELTKKSNNLFGIKADQRWSGGSIEVNTTENYNDKIVARFRSYNSIKESIKDHGKFLYENIRYKDSGLFNATHYTTQAQALEDAGYSTKENDKGEKIYADILVNLIRNYNLQVLDQQVQSK